MANIFLAMRLAAMVAVSFMVVKQLRNLSSVSATDATAAPMPGKVVKVQLAPPVRSAQAPLAIRPSSVGADQNMPSLRGEISTVALKRDKPSAALETSGLNSIETANASEFDASIYSCSGAVASEILQPNSLDVSTLWKVAPQIRKASEGSMGVSLLPGMLRGE